LAQNGKEFTFGTVEDMEVTSIKAGTAGTNAKLDRDGLTITSSGNPVKLTNNGLNNGDHTIVGVAAALGDAGSPASDSTLGPTSGLNMDGKHDHIWDSVVPTFIHYNIPLLVFGWIAAMTL